MAKVFKAGDSFDPLDRYAQFYESFEYRKDEYFNHCMHTSVDDEGREDIALFLFRLFRKEVSEIVCKHLVGEKTDEEYVFEGSRAYDTGEDIDLYDYRCAIGIDALVDIFQHSEFLPDEGVFLKYASKIRVKYSYHPILDDRNVNPKLIFAYKLGDLVLTEYTPLSEFAYVQFDPELGRYGVAYPPFVYEKGVFLYHYGNYEEALIDKCFDKFEVEGDVLSLSRLP